MSNVITSVGVGSWHPQGIERLRESLTGPDGVGWQGEVKTWVDEFPPNSPAHEDNPYAFKVLAFEECFKDHRYVLWCDSSVWAIKNPEPIFSAIQNDGYWFWRCGHYCDTWTSNFCLDYFGVTREQAHDIPMISASIMGLDRDHPKGKEFFDRWKASMLAGAFKGKWTRVTGDPEQPPCLGHRHDQSAASLIIHQMGLKFDGTGLTAQYWEPGHPERINAPVILTLCGM